MPLNGARLVGLALATLLLPLGASSQAAQTKAPIALGLIRVEPAEGVLVLRKRFEISATFVEPVKADSLRVALDERDVTHDAFVSDRSFAYEPDFDVPPGTHIVTLAGKTIDNEPFSERWTFASRESTDPNFITGLEPPNGIAVGKSLNISAFTKPHARVQIIAMTSPTFANFSDATPDSTWTAVAADGRGYFNAHLPVASPSSGILDVLIASTALDGSQALKTLRLRQ